MLNSMELYEKIEKIRIQKGMSVAKLNKAAGISHSIMSYNELYEHKKSDTVKWVLTLIAFIVVGILLAGILAGWFDKKEDAPAAVTEQTTVMDGGMSVTPTSATGVRLMMAQAAAEVSPLAETSYTIKATIEPASARQNANWSVAWANGSSAWATGKTVTDYVTITPTEEGSLTATLACVKPFSEQVILTVSAMGNADKTATCTVDYQQRLTVNSLKLGGGTLSTDSCGFKAQVDETHSMEIDYTYSEGTIPYLGEGDDGYDEFICAGIAFTDEFMTAYAAIQTAQKALRGSHNRHGRSDRAADGRSKRVFGGRKRACFACRNDY